ncbi:MAG: PD40 domain-containing protein, partial [Prevotella sp.]|nr:PD40 domain-containing protein [Prevotella sp.]
LGAPNKSYTSPQLSPDGNWILVVGSSKSEKEKTENTDIFVVRTDGTLFTQLTYHPGHDLSPVWSPDGKSIFFLSQRGSVKGNYNVWRMDFNL